MSTPALPTLAEVDAAMQPRFQLSVSLQPGAQASVFRARRISDQAGGPSDDDVVLKLYLPWVEVERVEREVGAMSRIYHPCLGRMVEHGTVDIGMVSYRYVAWEFVDGASLDHRLTSGALPPSAVAVIGRDVALAIEALWTAEKIVHRDIKPGNIMVRAGEVGAVLIDLGVARHLLQGTLTAINVSWGTQGYLSPEQAQAEKNLSCKSDLFSLGVTLLEALRGSHPTNRDQLRFFAVPRRTSLYAPGAPAALAEVIDQLLSPRPVFRPEPAVVAAKFDRLLSVL